MTGPVRYAVTAPRSNELVAWLGFNGVSACDVPYPSEIWVETADGAQWFIRYEAYVRSGSGTILYDVATESFEYEERLASMEFDPPMWWLKEAAPSAGFEGAACPLAG